MTRSAAAEPYPARAIVLRTRPLGEKDRILTLFSGDHGRISAVAKGARGPKSKLAAAAQPYVVARFLLARGRSLHIVTQVQVEAHYASLHTDLLKGGWAAYACELTEQTAEDLPDPAGYEILAVTLNTLEQANSDDATQATGTWFEAQWLQHQGYTPTIGTCVQCGIKIGSPGESVRFSATEGGTLCPHCSSASARLVSTTALRTVHRLLQASGPPAALGPEADEVTTVLRKCLALHVHGKLKALGFLREVQLARALHS